MSLYNRSFKITWISLFYVDSTVLIAVTVKKKHQKTLQQIIENVGTENKKINIYILLMLTIDGYHQL